MREGAYDYICKPFDNEELMLLVQKAFEKQGLRQENKQLRDSLSPEKENLLVGKSVAMQGIWALINKVATSRSTGLVVGESGTGKELVAPAIHWKSSRSLHPFLPSNTAPLPHA